MYVRSPEVLSAYRRPQAQRLQLVGWWVARDGLSGYIAVLRGVF